MVFVFSWFAYVVAGSARQISNGFVVYKTKSYKLRKRQGKLLNYMQVWAAQLRKGNGRGPGRARGQGSKQRQKEAYNEKMRQSGYKRRHDDRWNADDWRKAGKKDAGWKDAGWKDAGWKDDDWKDDDWQQQQHAGSSSSSSADWQSWSDSDWKQGDSWHERKQSTDAEWQYADKEQQSAGNAATTTMTPLEALRICQVHTRYVVNERLGTFVVRLC
jgi:hypothetical protein